MQHSNGILSESSAGGCWINDTKPNPFIWANVQQAQVLKRRNRLMANCDQLALHWGLPSPGGRNGTSNHQSRRHEDEAMCPHQY